MYYLEVAPIILSRKDSEHFTYSSAVQVPVGTIVTIMLGKKTTVGIVLAKTKKPMYECKQIASIVDETALPIALIKTAKWMSAYYQTHLSSTLNTLLPSGITKKRQKKAPLEHKTVRASVEKKPTSSQQKAIDTIIESASTTHLLHGVTGSGKTLVYIECAKKLFKDGLSSIILVPEIALTSQTLDEFKQVLHDDVLVTHSRQTEAQRHAVWLRALHAKTPKIVIGPRSALFLPIANLGMIVLDEFHEPSYKQEQQPRYSSLRVATILARAHGKTRVVFGSATPPVAEYYLAESNNAPIIKLSKTAKKSIKPRISIVDMRKRDGFSRHRFLSDSSLSAINSSLDSGRQVLLFHNRRGTTTTTLCNSCGWSAVDPDSSLPLTLHADKHLLISHITSYSMKVPTSCPDCNSVDILHKGIGTKLIESELQKLYPNKNIVRFDGDSSSANSVDLRYEELYRGDIDIIIGTQVIAKGIDLPKLGAVCIVQADAGLALPDYTASERTFQLLSQAIGRVGRNGQKTEVVVQTYQPEHPAITHGINQDFDAFYELALTERRKSHFPPYAYLAKFTCAYKTESAAIANSKKLLQTLKKESSNKVLFFGPAPAFYEKQGGNYRWTIVAKSPSRQNLSQLVRYLPSTKYWQFELDPISLL